MRTRVGYAGGTTADPTYTDLGDHAESIELEYDPELLDFDDLLALYWEGVSAASTSCTQYAPIIFWHDEEQRAQAQASWEAQGEPELSFMEAGTFHPAEDYHQKYILKRFEPVYQDFQRMYPEHEDIVRSTAAARCNGILAGKGTWEELGDELDSYGLGDEARALIESYLR